MKTKVKIVSVRLDPKLWIKVKIRAIKEDCSVQCWVEQAILQKLLTGKIKEF